MVDLELWSLSQIASIFLGIAYLEKWKRTDRVRSQDHKSNIGRRLENSTEKARISTS